MIEFNNNLSALVEKDLLDAKNPKDISKQQVQHSDENRAFENIQLKRRKFLGLGLLGMAGLGLPFRANGFENNYVEDFVNDIVASETDLFKKHSDSFEDKMKLMQKAWDEKDFRMVRSLSDSIRNTGIQAQNEYEDPGKPLVNGSQFGTVDKLPAAWRTWAKGWKYYKVIGLEEKAGISRIAEPVEVLLGFRSLRGLLLYQKEG